MKTALGVILGVQATLLVVSAVLPNFSRSASFVLGLLTIAILMQAVHKLINAKQLNELIEEQVAARTSNLVEMVAHYEQQAMTDALTGLLNRRGGEDSITHHIARCRRLKTAFSFVLVDIDHFKAVNDRYGHAIGDTVIAGVANAIKENLRTADFGARWGGEEFLLCLPDTDLAGAIIAAEKLRQVVEKTDFDVTPVTISLGCAELGEDPFQLALARADMHLYLAKSQGRNRIFPNSLQKVLDRS